MRQCPSLFLSALIIGALVPGAIGQETTSRSETTSQTAPDEMTTTGTVVSSARNTLIVRTDSRVYYVFTFDRGTVKPEAIPINSTVRVTSTPGGEPGVRLASNVVVTNRVSASAPKESQDPVPAEVRRIEDQIERQARKYNAGLYGGVSLDPEILNVGVFARLGPFFRSDISFRPSLEFGFGEVTKLFALNMEGIYRLPFTPRSGRWNAYVGAGPSLVLSHQNFERAAAGDRGIDFGDFDAQGGLNILTGIEYRGGLFFEAKTTVYATPHLRLIVGHRF